MIENDKPRVASLFAGAGGLDIGSHLAGFQSVACVELEPVYAESLRSNKWISHASPSEFNSWFDGKIPRMGRIAPGQLELFRRRVSRGVGLVNSMSYAQIIESDIANVSGDDLMEVAQVERGELDLMIGGPPCQSFSKSGKKLSLDDLRGQLFLQYTRLLTQLRPRFFLFENVRGITHSRAEVAKATCPIHGEFMPSYNQVLIYETLGFVRCSRCGKRAENFTTKTDARGALKVILSEFESIGYTCQVHLLNAADFGVPQLRERLFIIGSRDGEYVESPRPTHGDSVGSIRQESLLENSDIHPWATAWSALFDTPNPYHPWPLNPDEARLWVKNVVRPHAEPVTWDLRRPSPTIGAHQGAKLAIAPFGVPEEQIWRQQWHTAGRRQRDRPPVDVIHEYLSDEDLLVLQSFPRTWFIDGTRMERAFQIGNAVPPLLGRAVLEPIADALGVDSSIVNQDY